MTTFQFPPKSSGVVIGPPLEGKKDFLYQQTILALKSKIPVLYITTDTSPEDIKKKWLERKFMYGPYEKDALLRFIDCYSYNAGNLLKTTTSIRRVSGPLALNEISVAISDIEREFIQKNPAHLIIFDSLSTLLMYSNPQTVGRFIQVMSAKIKRAGGSIFFSIEQEMHEKMVITTIEHLMNTIINVKKEKGKVMIKVAGVKGYDGWFAL